MTDIASRELPVTDDWERRQKQATFFQTLLGSVQQSAISANTASAVIITLGGAMAKFSDVLPSYDWVVLLLATVAWVITSAIMVASFSRSAVRIEATYRREHALYFPKATPYRLESFLLDFADRNPALVGKALRWGRTQNAQVSRSRAGGAGQDRPSQH